MSLTLKSTVKLSSGHGLPLLGLGVYQNNECYPACAAALKHGYLHIDSAQMYKNEAEVGRAVRDSDIPREDVFITSKIMSGAADPDAVVQQSLDKIGVGYIDLYLIHSPHGGSEARLKAWKSLIGAKEKGQLRDIGVSNYNVKHIEEIRAAGLEMPAVNQIELHPFCQQKPIVEYCKKNNIVVEAYCPLVRGAFDDPVLQDVSKKVGRSPAQVLVRWSLQHGFVPLPKSANPDRIKHNAEVYDFELSDGDMKKLDGLDRGKDGAISWNPVDVD